MINPDTLIFENQETQKCFSVGDIPVFGNLILAPMDGLSDLPFRSLARRLGSAMSYTEFINCLDVINGHPYLQQRLSYYPFERPVVYQIFDDDPERMVKAALLLQDYQPDIIDVNLGCSAKTVTNRGAGAALLQTPQKIGQIISGLANALPVPVTAKIRLGWDDQSRNYLEVAHIIEESGAKLLAVHGRTKMQAYAGSADWEAIARIKQAASIPVIANGDVRTVADIDRISALTHCDGVMIGRGAIFNPWLFSRLDREQVPVHTVLETMLQHLEEMVAYYGPQYGVQLFRKYAKRLLSPYPIDRDKLTVLLTEEDYQQVTRLLSNLLIQQAGQESSENW